MFGPSPQNLPSRTAISAVIGDFSARILCSICRDTPSACAAAETDMSSAGSTSSRSRAPGWVGMRLIEALLGRSVVLLQIDVDGVLAVPAERDAPGAVHVNREPLRPAAQR